MVFSYRIVKVGPMEIELPQYRKIELLYEYHLVPASRTERSNA